MLHRARFGFLPAALLHNPKSSVAGTSISAGTTMTVKAATTLDIKSEAVGTLLFSGNGSTVTANNGSGTAIELTGHVHSQGADSAGDTQTNTNAPVA